jgi:hypothetical protein
MCHIEHFRRCAHRKLVLISHTAHQNLCWCHTQHTKTCADVTHSTPKLVLMSHTAHQNLCWCHTKHTKTCADVTHSTPKLVLMSHTANQNLRECAAQNTSVRHSYLAQFTWLLNNTSARHSHLAQFTWLLNNVLLGFAVNKLQVGLLSLTLFSSLIQSRAEQNKLRFWTWNSFAMKVRIIEKYCYFWNVQQCE